MQNDKVQKIAEGEGKGESCRKRTSTRRMRIKAKDRAQEPLSNLFLYFSCLAYLASSPFQGNLLVPPKFVLRKLTTFGSINTLKKALVRSFILLLSGFRRRTNG